jgi:DNA-binding NtrC family response regulator
VRTRFLVIGDDKQVSHALRSVFDEPHEVTRAADATEALGALAQQGANVVLLNQDLFVPSNPAVDHVSEEPVASVVWMAVDLKAVKVVGEMLKALAEVRSPVAPRPKRQARSRD